MSVVIYACTACGHACFPARQICHRCGSDAWQAISAERGVVEEVTAVTHQADVDAAPVCILASIRTVQGVVLLARLDRAVPVGQTVALALTDGRASARAVGDA